MTLSVLRYTCYGCDSICFYMVITTNFNSSCIIVWLGPIIIQNNKHRLKADYPYAMGPIQVYLQPVACRRSWMPGAKEVLECPKIFLHSCRKILTTFLVIYRNFYFYNYSSSPKNLTTFFSHSPISCMTHCHNHFSLILSIFLHFFKKTGSLDASAGWMPPQAGCPGPSLPRTPSARHCLQLLSCIPNQCAYMYMVYSDLAPRGNVKTVRL